MASSRATMLNNRVVRAIFLIVLLVFFISLDRSLTAHLVVWGAAPNILLALTLLTMVWMREKWPRTAVLFGFVAGFLFDMVTTTPVGSATLAVGIAGLLTVRIADVFQEVNAIAVTSFLFVSSVVYVVVFTLFAQSMQRVLYDTAGSFSVVPLALSVVYTTLVGLLMWSLFKLPRVMTRR